MPYPKHTCTHTHTYTHTRERERERERETWLGNVKHLNTVLKGKRDSGVQVRGKKSKDSDVKEVDRKRLREEEVVVPLGRRRAGDGRKTGYQ